MIDRDYFFGSFLEFTEEMGHYRGNPHLVNRDWSDKPSKSPSGHYKWS